MDDVDGRMARKFQLTSSIGATLDLGTDVTAHFMVTASALCYPLVECDTLTFSISLASFCTAVVLQQVYDDMLELACGTPSVAASDTAAYALGFCEKELPRAKAKKLARSLGWIGHGLCRQLTTPAIVLAFFFAGLLPQVAVLAAQLVGAAFVMAACKLAGTKWHA